MYRAGHIAMGLLGHRDTLAHVQPLSTSTPRVLFDRPLSSHSVPHPCRSGDPSAGPGCSGRGAEARRGRVTGFGGGTSALLTEAAAAKTAVRRRGGGTLGTAPVVSRRPFAEAFRRPAVTPATEPPAQREARARPQDGEERRGSEGWYHGEGRQGGRGSRHGEGRRGGRGSQDGEGRRGCRGSRDGEGRRGGRASQDSEGRRGRHRRGRAHSDPVLLCSLPRCSRGPSRPWGVPRRRETGGGRKGRRCHSWKNSWPTGTSPARSPCWR